MKRVTRSDSFISQIVIKNLCLEITFVSSVRKNLVKWNANRHNNTVHSGMSNVFNNETGMVADNKKLHSNYEVDGVDQDDLDGQIIRDFGKNVKKFQELENLLSHTTRTKKIDFYPICYLQYL